MSAGSAVRSGGGPTAIVVDGFESVVERFEAIGASRPGWSGSLAVYVDGAPVIDTWTGPAYRGSELQAVYSCTKGLGAACLALLIQRGLLDPDARVAQYWPEFAAAGKQDVTVRVLLSHRAGLIAVDGGYTLEQYIEHTALAARLAAQRPHWEPGTRHGYHSLLMGPLMRELLWRVTGQTTRDFYDTEMRTPYELDFTLGCPPDRRDRIAPHHFPEPGPMPPEFAERIAANPLMALAFTRTFPLFETPYTEASMDADLPAVNGFASARGLAKFYAALTTGVESVTTRLGPLLSPETIAVVSAEQASGLDAVLPVDMAFGMGFMVPMARIPQAGPGSFGHDGAAGALAYANPRHGLAFGWVSDTVVSQGADPATAEIGQAIVDIVSR